MINMNTYLNSIDIGSPQVADNLTLFPLLGQKGQTADYRVVDDAVSQAHLRIREVSGSGSVPRLLLENNGDLPVLLVDGEELVGCKQNRIINLSILAPAGKSLEIPVSCVEQGRWSHHSDHFKTTNRTQYASGRARKMAQVSRSMKNGIGHSADQSEVWEHLACKQSSVGSRSRTGAMSDMFEQQERKLGRYRRRIRPVEQQVGGIFAINGRVIGLELFDAQSTFEHYLPKLINSYALEALDHHTTLFPAPDIHHAENLLDAISASSADCFPSLGLGEDIRLEGKSARGAALAHDQRLIHLVAFDTSIEKTMNDRGSGYSRQRSARLQRRVRQTDLFHD